MHITILDDITDTIFHVVVLSFRGSLNCRWPVVRGMTSSRQREKERLDRSPKDFSSLLYVIRI